MSSEMALRCNDLNCTSKLEKEAYVTSCYHIFCAHHAKTIISQSPTNRFCLVCRVPLTRDKDIISKDLKPKENYKSIVLCGLTPDQIFEIANKGIKFYNRQLEFQARKDKHLMEKEFQKKMEEANKSQKKLVQKLQKENQELKRKQSKISNGNFFQGFEDCEKDNDIFQNSVVNDTPFGNFDKHDENPFFLL